jgi:hypothetical protein
MATDSYMVGRKKYGRPQALLFSNNPGYISDGKIIPDGEEFKDFIILSDDNRESIRINPERIEKKQRMINGRMRSYHVADKLRISTSWNLLPSRAFIKEPEFETREAFVPGRPTGFTTSVFPNGVEKPVALSGSPYFQDQQYTTDGGAGGADILDWYNKHPGSFWVFLSYDNYKNLNDERDRLSEYSEVVEVFFESFQYDIDKRGQNNSDYWNVSFSLEEV